MHRTLNILADYELLLNVDTPDETHSIEKIGRMIVLSSATNLLDNFFQEENDNTSNKLSKKKTLKMQLNFLSVIVFNKYHMINYFFK